MKIENIARINLDKNDVLWVKVNNENLLLASWKQHAEAIQGTLQNYFPNNRIIITGDDVDIKAIKPEN